MHFSFNTGAWHVTSPLVIKAGGSQRGPWPWLQQLAHWSIISQSSSEATKYPAWWPVYKLCLLKVLSSESQTSLWWPVERSRKSFTYSKTKYKLIHCAVVVAAKEEPCPCPESPIGNLTWKDTVTVCLIFVFKRLNSLPASNISFVI